MARTQASLEFTVGQLDVEALPGDDSLTAQRASQVAERLEEDLEPTLERLLGSVRDRDRFGDLADGPPVPRARPDEFVCSGCFLIWNRRRMADPAARLCLDCLDSAGLAPAA